MSTAMSPMSREDTPSSASSGNLEVVGSSSASNTESSQDQSSQSAEDTERLLKRMDMEKTMHNLQQRLELASVKASNGWKDLSIREIETRLPPTSPRNRNAVHGYPSSSSSTPYQPPSPSRPWQLIDVLWQPLPPPSNARYPPSPSSPRKRSRDDPLQDISPTHRRASSFAYHPASPLGQVRFAEKKRSLSHSHTTSQDVDAAKALTAMLGSASPGSSSLSNSNSLPIPPRSVPPAFRTRSNSMDRSSKRRQNTLTVNTDRKAEDTDAAELMMFLAHSPSPVRKVDKSGPSRGLGGAARVLFADEEEGKRLGTGSSPSATGHGVEVQAVGSAGHSNLAVAEPITASRGGIASASGVGVGAQAVGSAGHSNLAVAEPITAGQGDVVPS